MSKYLYQIKQNDGNIVTIAIPTNNEYTTESEYALALIDKITEKFNIKLEIANYISTSVSLEETGNQTIITVPKYTERLYTPWTESRIAELLIVWIQEFQPYILIQTEFYLYDPETTATPHNKNYINSNTPQFNKYLNSIQKYNIYNQIMY